MAATKAVGIRELKDHLSAYLREVRGGLRILVLDREQMIAELHQPSPSTAKMAANPILLAWANRSLITLPKSEKKKKCPPSPLQAAEGTARRLLAEDRGE
jgi:antitoxin (DNA-binding transcriptional repressor) of toxin-antitoxin stability system